MPTRKAAKKGEKSYTYEEFLKTFYPKPKREQEPTPRDPKIFGNRLAEAALKKIKESSDTKP
jgi:hypothetical protein